MEKPIRVLRCESNAQVHKESIFLSRVEGRGSRVEGRGFHVEGEGSMSRARVPCRGSRVTFVFLEKVIIDAINFIKTNKNNLKRKWRVNIL